MGRGRAKAKQAKVARQLKYHTPDTDLGALERELSGSSEADEDYDDPYAAYIPGSDKDEPEPREEDWVPKNRLPAGAATIQRRRWSTSREVEDRTPGLPDAVGTARVAAAPAGLTAPVAQDVGLPTMLSPMAESTLDELSTGELRERAFHRARQHHDLGFFWDVVRHLPHAPEAEEVDGSLGSVGAAIDSVVALWHELTGDGQDYGPAEPLLRAKFIDYLAQRPS